MATGRLGMGKPRTFQLWVEHPNYSILGFGPSPKVAGQNINGSEDPLEAKTLLITHLV